MSFEMVVGLEVHTQLKTQSKMFSNTSTCYGQPANTQASWIDLALPGTLPVVNEKALQMAIMFGLAVDATISKDSFFARKNYFYPDLAKGYQISQSHNPIVQNGQLVINTSKGEKNIRIERAHLEEDAGKSVHNIISGRTGIDYNRAGTPLLEIVTQPDFRSAEEVVSYLKSLHRLVRHLGICDGNMQEGSFRCDVNLSIRRQGEINLGVRTELKNLNSFRFIEAAIHYEYQRQVDVLTSGKQVVQETRLYDPDRNETKAMRSKENAFDYRYFPDPDLLVLQVSQNDIDNIKQKMPLLPQQRQQHYLKFLSLEEVNYLMDNPDIADYYDQVCLQGIAEKVAYNWASTEVQGLFNRLQKPFDKQILPAAVLVEIIEQVNNDQISMKSAKTVIQTYTQEAKDINQIIDALGLRQSNDSAFVESIVDEIIANNPQQVKLYKEGKTKLLGFFVGQAMKQSKGKANPKQVNEVVIKKLS